MVPRILVVDDETEYLSLIEAFAAAHLVDTIKIDQWSEACLSQITDQDLLIMDIHMPGVDGMDILMQLSERSYLGGIIVMSGSDEALIDSVCNLARKLKLNLIGSLHKPFRLSAFKTLLDIFLQRPPVKAKVVTPVESMLTSNELQAILDGDLFYPVFQPQLNAQTRRVFSVECLCRLKDSGPASGVSLPVFLQSLSSRNMIHSFTLKFIEKAVEELADILTVHPELRVSFNIDPRSLRKETVQQLLECTKSRGIPQNRITFEITESNVLRMDSESLFCIAKLRSSGAQLSIDDVGTGYSTLQSFIELPFSELKIDRSFIARIDQNDKALELIRALQSMADNLKFSLVCEGVETEHQLKKLLSIGCCIIQGYHFSKPLGLAHLRDYLAETQREGT